MRVNRLIALALIALTCFFVFARAEDATPPVAVRARSASASSSSGSLPFYLANIDVSIDAISRSVMEIDDTNLVKQIVGKYSSPPPPAPPPFLAQPPSPPSVQNFLAEFASNYTTIFNSQAELNAFNISIHDRIAQKLNLTSSQVAVTRIARTGGKVTASRHLQAASQLFLRFSITFPPSATDLYIQRTMWYLVHNSDMIFTDTSSFYNLALTSVKYQTVSPPSPPPSDSSDLSSLNSHSGIVSVVIAAVASLFLWMG